VIQKLALELTGALTDSGQRDLRACRLPSDASVGL
jgi:hypothetical protein